MDNRLELLVSMVRFKLITELSFIKHSFKGVFQFVSFFLLIRNWFIPNSAFLASELTAAAIILQFWTPHLVPWQWAIIIIVPIFALQLIHVRVYGANPSFFYILFVFDNLIITRWIWILVCDDKGHHDRTFHNCWSNIWLGWYQRSSRARRSIPLF